MLKTGELDAVGSVKTPWTRLVGSANEDDTAFSVENHDGWRGGDEVVIVPTFNAPEDRLALNILAELFPAREVIGIHAVDLIWGMGTLHCLTQQEPAGGR